MDYIIVYAWFMYGQWLRGWKGTILLLLLIFITQETSHLCNLYNEPIIGIPNGFLKKCL